MMTANVYPITCGDFTSIKSRLGDEIDLLDEYGETLDIILIPAELGRIVRVPIEELRFDNDDLNSAFNDWLINKIQHYQPLTIEKCINVIKYFHSIYHQTDSSSHGNYCDFIEHIFDRTLSENSRDLNSKSVLKDFYKYCLLNEADGFVFEYYYDLEDKRVGRKNGYARVLRLDPVFGPFLDSELTLLTPLQSREDIDIDVRVILGLAQTFGLRTKQISLLREEDFYQDSAIGEFFINVPRLKQGTQTSRSAFTKRVITSEILVLLIKDLIATNKEKTPNTAPLPRPLIFRRQYSEEHRNFRGESEYFHHATTGSIGSLLRNIPNLPISPRTGELINLTIYRFRYTVGTNAVMDGKSESEVAALLDHSYLGSVKHYFKLTEEMGGLLDELTDNSLEQKSFVAAWHKIDEMPDNIYSSDIVETRNLACLGKCSKSTSCDYEPAVACYGCKSFFAGKDASAHREAAKYIEERIVELVDTSTGHVPNQLVQAKIGVLAAIRYAEEDDE